MFENMLTQETARALANRALMTVIFDLPGVMVRPGATICNTDGSITFTATAGGTLFAVWTDAREIKVYNYLKQHEPILTYPAP